MKSSSARTIALLGILAAMGVAAYTATDNTRGQHELPPPQMLYTACSQVTDLALASNGDLWAATRGGLICWHKGETKPSHWTTANGISGNELRCVALGPDGAYAACGLSLDAVSQSGRISPLGTDLRGREIRCLLGTDEGCWIGTSDGAYLCKSSKFEKRLSGSIIRMASNGQDTWAVTSSGITRIGAKTYQLPQDVGNVTAFAASENSLYLASALGFWRFENGKWSAIGLPKESYASHISALVARGELVYAALYGDGLFVLKSGRWTRMNNTPGSLAKTTSLVCGSGGVIAGTQADGVWEQSNNKWNRRAMPPSIPSADIYSIAVFDGSVWASTFDQGLLRLENGVWKTLTKADGLATNSPRDLVPFSGKLYVRHTTGQLDCFDGKSFARAFTKDELPREAYALCTDGKRLYIGSWAGWAATDGTSWERHFKDAQLEGQVTTAIAADSQTVWIGTQKAGAFVYKNGKITQYHEGSGLADDWITCICADRGRVLVGTFTAGVFELKDDRFKQALPSEGFAIRAINLIPGTTQALTATALGLYKESPEGWKLLPPADYGGLEIQCICIDSNSVWVGGRTSLANRPLTSL